MCQGLRLKGLSHPHSRIRRMPKTPFSTERPARGQPFHHALPTDAQNQARHASSTWPSHGLALAAMQAIAERLWGVEQGQARGRDKAEQCDPREWIGRSWIILIRPGWPDILKIGEASKEPMCSVAAGAGPTAQPREVLSVQSEQAAARRRHDWLGALKLFPYEPPR